MHRSYYEEFTGLATAWRTISMQMHRQDNCIFRGRVIMSCHHVECSQSSQGRP